MEYIDTPERSDKELVEKILETADKYDSDMKQTLDILNETLISSASLAERIGKVNASLKNNAVSSMYELIKGLRPQI